MPYREVGMLQIKEVLRLWLAGVPKKRIAALVQVDRKTVRRYIALATEQGLTPAPGGAITLTDEQLAAVLLALKRDTGRSHGESWARCVEHRAFIEDKLRGAKLSKVRRLLLRQGIEIPYPTLHRFAVTELGFGRAAPTIPVSDPEPGMEVQLDTGWMTALPRSCLGSDGASARGSSRRLFALPLRLSRAARDDGIGDRGVRGGVGVFRRRVSGPHSR